MGVRKGWSGFVWMMKILVPISLLTSILSWTGWLETIQFAIQPLMNWLSLPAAAALPLLIGIFTGLYGAIATMVVLPLSREHMTLIAIFLLIAHNLILEGIIQGKSGLNALTATLYRLIAAIAAVLVSALFLDVPATIPVDTVSFDKEIQPFAVMLQGWFLTTLVLGLKMFIIVMGVLILLEVTKALGWIDRFVRICRPALRALGLTEKSGIIWMTSAIFGLAYAAAVVVEEAKGGHFDKEELEGLHLSVGINHAMIEDPAIFLALGLPPFWLWVPRLVAAILAVRVFSLWQNVVNRRQ